MEKKIQWQYPNKNVKVNEYKRGIFDTLYAAAVENGGNSGCSMDRPEYFAWDLADEAGSGTLWCTVKKDGTAEIGGYVEGTDSAYGLYEPICPVYGVPVAD